MHDISCFDALSRAWNRMKGILFRPFSLDKWLILGFCAWLAGLFDNWSGPFSFNFGQDFEPLHKGLRPVLACLKKFFSSHQPFSARLSEALGITATTLAIIVLIAAVVFVLSIAATLLALWVKSRFEFIFIDNLAMNNPEVIMPWRKYKNAGNSVFVFKLIIWTVSFMVFALMLITAFISLLPWIKHRAVHEEFTLPGWKVIAALGVIALLWIMFTLFVSLISFFFKELVLVIMYRKNLNALQGCYLFLGLLRDNLWLFVRYWLMKLALCLAFGVAVLLLILMTCCLAAIPLLIPYIGTVVLLPAFVFFRLLGMELLAAVGPELNVFPEPAPPQPAQK